MTLHFEEFISFLFHLARNMAAEDRHAQIGPAIKAEIKRFNHFMRMQVDGLMVGGKPVDGYKAPTALLKLGYCGNYVNHDDIDGLFRTPDYIKAANFRQNTQKGLCRSAT